MGFDNGMAPVVESAQSGDAKVPRSSFNMSRVVNTQGIIGALMPIDVLETLPNEDYTISYDSLVLTRNPMVRRFQNGMNLYMHSYWCAKKDLWRGWRNYITKGRNGDWSASVPKLYPCINKVSGESLDKLNTDKITFTPFAPSSYMGVPIACYDSTVTNKNEWFKPCVWTENNKVANAYALNNETKWGINALPFVMYNKIYRDFYANENILSKNKYWYHDDPDEDLILPIDLTATQGYTNTTTGEIVNVGTEMADAESNVYIPEGDTTQADYNKPILNALHFRQFKGDYFTTASIFQDMLRGNAEPIATKLSWDALVGTNSGIGSGAIMPLGLDISTSGTPDYKLYAGYINNDYVHKASASDFQRVQTKVLECLDKVKVQMTLNSIRKALVMEKIMERNADTGGNYRELIGAQFGYYPKDPNRKPTYIGGTYQPISFNEVVSTSGSTEDNRLGYTSSRGMSASNGYIGKFHSDDYGYIMTIACIVPDVYYNNTKLDKMWTRTEQDMEYLPIYNNLGAEPILKKELFIGTTNEYNNDVWGYMNRFEDMKSRQNIITGLGALGNNAVFDSANFMKRNLTNPVLNQHFLTMSVANIDMTPFTSKNEPPFDLMIGCNIDKVSPMPFKAHPCDMGISY